MKPRYKPNPAEMYRAGIFVNVTPQQMADAELKLARDYHGGDRAVGYTDAHAEGAMENGQRIVKVWSEPGDLNPVGTQGVVVGSLHHPDLGYAYFVKWDTRPDVPIAVVAKKIEACK